MSEAMAGPVSGDGRSGRCPEPAGVPVDTRTPVAACRLTCRPSTRSTPRRLRARACASPRASTGCVSRCPSRSITSTAGCSGRAGRAVGRMPPRAADSRSSTPASRAIEAAGSGRRCSVSAWPDRTARHALPSRSRGARRLVRRGRFGAARQRGRDRALARALAHGAAGGGRRLRRVVPRERTSRGGGRGGGRARPRLPLDRDRAARAKRRGGRSPRGRRSRSAVDVSGCSSAAATRPTC